MKFEITSEVIIPGIGKANHTHIQEFEDDSNVFSRVSEYHKYMHTTFPECEFRLVEARKL